ncbi:MAG: DUF7619 domain-containing protein, partial [Thermoplasmata archaeon]
STTNTITFTESNGTYTYTIGPINGFTAYPSSGVIDVNGANVNQVITFSMKTYTVTFTENGLPNGTIWFVNLSNGQSFFSSTNIITFQEPNGSYTYTIATVNKEYSPSRYSGIFNLNGSNITINVNFKVVTYSIIFEESGLPDGTLWAVTLNGNTISSTTNTITFTESNGTYTYTIGPINGFT